MSSAFDLLNKRTKLTSQKSDESESSARKRRFADADEESHSHPPAKRTHDSRWQPAEDSKSAEVKAPEKRTLKETGALVDLKVKE